MRRWAVGSLASAVIAIGCEGKTPLVRAQVEPVRARTHAKAMEPDVSAVVEGNGAFALDLSGEPEPVRVRARAKTLEPDVAAVIEGNSEFALDLYARLRENEGNLFFSPYSISVALAMTYAGARGETAAEMRKALHLTLEQERLHPAFAKLAAGIKPRGCELHIANRLWGQKGYKFLDSFLKLTEEHYGAPLEQVDFAGAREEARRAINAWVEERTRDRIKELIPPGILDPLTRLVLTNAIYFKGDWANPFEVGSTTDAPFFLPRRGKVRVPMMQQWEYFRYAAFSGLQVLEMRYKGRELSMLVLLPKKRDGLPALEESLTEEKLRGWLSRLRARMVEVYFPRFEMTSDFELKPVLSSMGMPSAFCPREADLSGMTGKKELFISHVLHEAFVHVDEIGTEAAAATAGVAEALMSMEEPPVFRADHPFLFLILENRTGSILFLGRVVNPLEGRL